MIKKFINYSLILFAAFILAGCTAPVTQVDQGVQLDTAPAASQGGRQTSMSDLGILQYQVNEPQSFHLEAKGATRAWIRNMETDDIYELQYNPDLKLWIGDLLFTKAGYYHLEGNISGSQNNTYTREINSVLVVDKPTLTTSTGETPEEVIATIYVKDPATGEFNVWNGLAFGQENPVAIPDGLSVVLPTGEYYVEVEAKDYDPITSLITIVNQQSIITADINLGQNRSWGDKFMSLFTKNYASTNFSLNITEIPQETLLKIGDFLPVITATDITGAQKVFLNKVYDKPVIIFVFSTWNTEAQEQMDAYESLVSNMQEQYKFINLSTIEPIALNKTKIARGDYSLEFYQPNDQFFDDYKIISLPQFFLANNRGELLGVIVGSFSEADLMQKINDIYGN